MAEPTAKSVFETPLDKAEEHRRDAQAEAEIDAGQGIPHERVREWLAQLAKGKKLPPPSV